jgi:phospholipase/carboxylesterase
MTLPIDGPRIEPGSGVARKLVVILHGYGADGHDLIGLGHEWADFLPDTAFVAPHAHEACVHMPSGRQWFALTDRNPHERWSGACTAAPVIDAFIDAELKARGLNDSDLALVGFSQGAMMALHVGLRRKQAPAAVLSYSGVLVGPERLEEAIAGRPPEALPAMFLVHGSHDEVIPVEALFGSANAIQAAGGACQSRVVNGMGHNIDAECLSHGAIFLARSLGLPSPEPLTQS